MNRKRYLGGRESELHVEGCDRLKDDNDAQELNMYQWAACINRGVSVCACVPAETSTKAVKLRIEGDLNTLHHDDGTVTLWGIDALRGPVEIELSEDARRWLLASLKTGARALNDEVD